MNKKPDVSNIKIKRPPSNLIVKSNNVNNNNVLINKPHSNHHINIKNDLYGKNNYSHQMNNNNNPSNVSNQNNNVQKPQTDSEKKEVSNKIRMFLKPKVSESDSKKSTNVSSSNNNNNNKVVFNKEKQPQLVSKKSAPNKGVIPSIKLDENKPKNPKLINNNYNLPRNNFPSIIIVDKHPIDDFQKEEQYNQHRYFNILNQIRNEIKEDPETYSDDDEEEAPKPIREVSNQQEIFQALSSNTPPPVIAPSQNAFSDFNEIEIIRQKLEDKLGMTLLKEVIKFVDGISDHQTVKFEYEKIEELKMKLEPRYTVDEINTAIDSVQEVFTIIVMDRLCNSK